MKETIDPINPNKNHEDIPGNPSTATSSKINLRTEPGDLPFRVLTDEDWSFWRYNGYVIIRNAVPREQALKTADFIWDFEEKDQDDQSTWYTAERARAGMKELVGTGMVEVYNHQLLWDNRQTQRVYDSFVDIWGREDLFVTIDRANLNFPMRPGFRYKGFIHWDYDPETKPQNVQGVLALCDQNDENMGGFQCIPELFRTYDTWKLTQPAGRDRFKPDVSSFTDAYHKPKMNAGDLLIFNSSLPHGIRPNQSNAVRVAQYISMMPAEPDNKELIDWRVNSWKNRVAPEGHAFPGDPRKFEQTKYDTAKLSDLGSKLLGLKAW